MCGFKPLPHGPSNLNLVYTIGPDAVIILCVLVPHKSISTMDSVLRVPKLCSRSHFLWFPQVLRNLFLPHYYTFAKQKHSNLELPSSEGIYFWGRQIIDL